VRSSVERSLLLHEVNRSTSVPPLLQDGNDEAHREQHITPKNKLIPRLAVANQAISHPIRPEQNYQRNPLVSLSNRVPGGWYAVTNATMIGIAGLCFTRSGSAEKRTKAQ
jgi:hypothetical protein